MGTRTLTTKFIDLGLQDLMQRARWACERSKAGHPSGVDAILFSAMAAETYPNDFSSIATLLVTDECSPQLATARDLLPQMENDKIQIRLKYQLLHFILSGKPFQKGENPYQDFDFLITLRNEIAHHKPTESINNNPAAYHQRVARIVTGLEKRKLISRPKKAYPNNWRMLLDDSNLVANWAFDTTRSIVIYMNALVPDSKFKKNYIDPMSNPLSELNLHVLNR